MIIRLMFLSIYALLGVKGDYLDVNGCFSQRPGFEVSVRVNEVKTTTTVQMKDECLRACLRTLLQEGNRCLSIMHMPKDNDCIISNAMGSNIAKAGERKVHNNYYENECAKQQLFQFKDECLRHCLSSSIHGTPCLSAMHVPDDDRCVLSDQDQDTRPDLFVENDAAKSFTVHYFRNTCVNPPGDEKAGGRVQARLQGFRGSEGVLEMAQVKGRNPKIMVIMNGLAPGRDYHILYSPTLDPAMCKKISSLKKDDAGEKLITVDSDQSGMAIQPWTEIDWHILDDSVLNKVLVVVESTSGIVVDCGQIKIKGNQSDWEAALNGVGGAYSNFIVSIILPLIALLIFAL